MDTKTVEKNIREGLWTHKSIESKKRSGKFWCTFDKIFIVRDDGADELVKEFVICRICQKIMGYDPTKGSSNLNTHANTCKDTSRHTLNAYVSRENVIKNVHKKELCFRTVAASAKDGRPFRLTECDGVIDLLHCAWNMGAKVGIVSKEQLINALPSSTTVSRNANRIATMSKDNLKSILKSEIRAETHFAMTTDIWQDKYKRISYCCITLHYFDKKTSKLVDFLITLWPMEIGKKKDNVYLKKIIDDKLIEYDLMEHVENCVFVSDRGGNIRVALKNYIRINCFPHFCHNIVKYACSVEDIKRLISCCSALVKYFKFNGLNNALETSLKSAISTRFNYIFMMFSSIDSQWDNIKVILLQRNELGRLNGIDRDILKGMITFLNVFNAASKATESTYKETLAYVWIGITQICSMCRVQPNDPCYTKAIKARSLEYIESKFILHKYHRIATFLHPNYKTLVFCSSGLKNKTIEDTKNLLDQMIATESSPNSTPSDSSSRRSSSSSEASFLSNYFGECDGQISEVDAYRNFQWIPTEKINVFDWWIERRSMFPKLYKVALKIHSIPASSMQSERTFSQSGLIVNDRRSNINPGTVEDLMLLNKNFDFKVIYIVSLF